MTRDQGPARRARGEGDRSKEQGARRSEQGARHGESVRTAAKERRARGEGEGCQRSEVRSQRSRMEADLFFRRLRLGDELFNRGKDFRELLVVFLF